ncbi:unnamed protein product [Parnassius mnemosyne]|uniref:Uncharacterized protein n=2 Tax=Parnassius mnemosyne TaxID=213953 RepID=A0AAV1M6S1_9NEOP
MENNTHSKQINDEKMKTNIHTDSAENNTWGYIVCFGIVITFIAGIGHVNSFGLIYNDFIIDTNSTAKSLTTAHGVFAIMLAIGGLILNIMLKNYSLRLSGCLGAVLYSTGSILTIFITNTNQLPITFGGLQGIGFGMMVPVCYSSLNYYFVRNRTQVMSIIKAIQGFALIWYPQLIKMLMSNYGFRGTLLIISGASFHTFPGMIVMKTSAKSTKVFKTARNVNGKIEENVDLLTIENGKTIVDSKVNGKSRKIKIDKMRKELLKLINMKVLKDPVFCNICIGQSFVNFSDLTFFILQPILLFQYGYTKTQVATCISISAGADVTGRCVLAIISGIVPINTRLLYYIATLFTLLVRIIMLQVRQFVFVAVVTAALGVLRAFLHVASPLVVSDYVSHQDFPGAYALNMLAAGLVNVIFAPFIGLVKDVYEDYVPAFYALIVCCLPCLLFWPVEKIFTK